MASRKTISSGHIRDLVSRGTLAPTMKMNEETNHECTR
jgi:hypothetical protein